MAADTWIVILAAGDGTRLRSVTQASDGTVVPKQFCAFGAGRTLMAATLARARKLAPMSRIVPVVAEAHRRWWELEVAELPPENVVVQPRNRGTAPGLLLPLLRVLGSDSSATVVVLPSDHEVEREDVLLAAIGDAERLAGEDASGVFLLGMTPDGPETEYGWIVPSSARTRSGTHRVRTFVEKPDRERALAAMRDGASWSSFIMVGRVGAFLDLYFASAPALLRSFLSAARRCPILQAGDPPVVLRELYDAMLPLDFSRDILQRESVRGALRLVPVAPCGWSDLGTPARLSRWLQARATA